MMNSEHRSLDIIRQELEASFISGGNKVLKPDWFPVVERVDPGMGSTYITVDLAGFKKQEGKKILRTDESVICVTLVKEDHWTVLNMEHGHWDVRETCLKIVQQVRNYTGSRLGIEAGALANACGPYLEEYMRAYQRYVTPEPLTHGNQRKIDRIQWALQGRGEKVGIPIVRGAWNDQFLSQVSDFPDPLAHDDMIDALAYCDQMAMANFVDPNLDTYDSGLYSLEADSTH